ncbi:glucose-6-phosphate dehydrogenase [soil metagenome]
MTSNTTTASKFTLPTIFVIFGITGDLVQKKILRALYHLYIKKVLPIKFRVYGFSRRPYDDEQLREYLRGIMKSKHFPEPEQYDKFLNAFFYIEGDFHEENAYGKLAEILGRADGMWKVCTNKLFYLAVPPISYMDIIKNLHKKGFTIPCSPEEGWTRVIVEKPFGTDLDTAIELDMTLEKLFKEEQIYRVDHYLAKETVRNILAFRFSNSFLTPAWNNQWIEKIEVKLFEKDTVSERGNFYDKIGTLRDVGQNHMLQLLALFIMDQPDSFTPEEIKKKRSEALESIKTPSPAAIRTLTQRAQYTGYRKEKGVDPDSTTETYFRIQATTTQPQFVGVPLILESGKALDQDLTEVVVTFKHIGEELYEDKNTPHNVLHYYLRPDESISMRFLAKKPGFKYELEEHSLGFDYRAAYANSAFVDDYEALMYDIINGDQTLFVSTKEILSQWQFIEPIVNVWEKGKPALQYYPKNTHVGTLSKTT